jgi:putative Flp pilus-assembly TadE/G-like protein
VLFAGSLVVLFLVAAMAFDIGMMMVERRDEQNAADAAALAGARYVLTSPNYSGTCTGAAGNVAANAACEVALANDFNDADAREDVFIHIPANQGEFKGFPGFVQVDIKTRRDAIFGGIMGQSQWPVSVVAVAADQPGVTYTFGMLALNETACKAIHISGSGTVNAAANVQSNSSGADCGTPPYGLSRTGTGVLNVTAPDATCRAVGDIQSQGSGSMNCAPAPFSFALPDPLADLPAPVKPALAASMQEVVGTNVVAAPANIPLSCPGDTVQPPSETMPLTCVLGQGAGQAGRKWILSPGLYPAGLTLKGGVTAYLLPGIYWIGGGGFQTSNNASVISVTSCTSGASPVCSGTGNVLIYNSKLPASASGPITLGGGGATLSLHPYAYPFGGTTINLVIFQDRTVSDTVTLNGSTSTATDVRGIVYAPSAQVKVNGSASTFTMDQVIADTFLINGNGGTVNVLRETGVDVQIAAVGLVQ